MHTNDLAARIEELAVAAGAEILAVYAEHDPGVRQKDDDSPVTEADVRAERLILQGLAEATPDIPIVAEESVAAGSVPEPLGSTFWLVDPLDGTKEFLSHNGEFTVNIALVREGAPELGVVHAPAVEATYVGGPGFARTTRAGATQDLSVVPAADDGVRVLVSRSHLDEATQAWLDEQQVKERVQAGSSLKFCRIAEGAADVYPRFGRTMWWDTAAGHAVLAAAGGSVRTRDGAALRYAGTDFANPGFIAYGG